MNKSKTQFTLGKKGGWPTSLSTVFATTALLSACSLITPPEAPRETYDLSVPDGLTENRRGAGSQILVKVPTALKSIDSERIIVRPSPSVITYLQGAQWGDTVPRLVQAKLVEAFENTGSSGATAKPGDGLVIDYQLVSDIRRFEILNQVATIEISIKLLADRTGLVRETRIFESRVRAGGQSAEDYVAAFNAAFGRIAKDIVSWVRSRT